MNLYEERLERDLSRIRRRLVRMGQAVRNALTNAVRAILEDDPTLAAETVLGDMPINRQAREIDHLCHLFVARHLPSAGHLRLTTAAMRLSKMLERIGDYAETIAREVRQIDARVPPEVVDDIRMLSQQAQSSLDQALDAFIQEDVGLARETRAVAAQQGSTFDKVFADLVRIGEETDTPTPTLFALLTVCNRLERVIHQSKNIVEQAVFAATGEQKEEKTFDILFVGLHNEGASQLAEHYCRRAYPEAGSFSSAGWDVAEDVANGLAEFAQSKGLDMTGATPQAFEHVADGLAKFDIVVDLTGKADDRIRRVPFHTTLLVWNLDRSRGTAGVYEDLVSRLGDLMETLRGEDPEN